MQCCIQKIQDSGGLHTKFRKMSMDEYISAQFGGQIMHHAI